MGTNPALARDAAAIEETAGVLPELPNVMNGILVRDDLDTKALAPVIAAFKAVVTGELCH